MENSGDFAATLAGLLGHAPHEPIGQAGLLASCFDTPLGAMICLADRERLHLLEFADRKALPAEMRRMSATLRGRIAPGRTAISDRAQAQMAAYFAGQEVEFTLELALHGTPFQREVWQELIRVPAGTTLSYGELARRMGRANATRAVARANGANQIAVMIPCHRIIGADGSLTGYGGGLWRKQALLRLESPGLDLGPEPGLDPGPLPMAQSGRRGAEKA